MSALPVTEIVEDAAAALAQVRNARPRIHAIMNTVTQKLVADGLSALGTIPSMTVSEDEIAGFVMKADALAVNLGTLDASRRAAIATALAAAQSRSLPWVLDPAHCDYSPPRALFAQELLASRPAVLRANEAEHQLLDVPAGIVSVRTGQTDHVASAGRVLVVENGHEWTAIVTGTGCLSGALIAAFLAVETDPFTAAIAAMLAVGIAAELAAPQAKGPGSFEPCFLDALAALTPDDLLQHARIRHEQD